MSIRQTACIYFALQAIAVGAWWLLLFFVPASRKFFQMGDTETTLLAFWLPDLLLLAAGSLTTSAFCFFDSKYTPLAAWFVCGAVAYATFYCLAFSFLTDSGWLGTTLMLPATLWSGCFTIALSDFKNMMFRQAKQSPPGWILAKTAIQIIVVWSLILFVFPSLIVQLEDKLGVSRFTFPLQKILSAVFFVLISLPGLASAFTMSKIGKGTPLPLDSASKLVVRGTYAYVRNPMAISGVGQGLAVGLFLGSPLVLIYALMGGLIWQFIFRPLEEIDLHERFGADYENYCRETRCWIPRAKPYQMDGVALSSNSIESPSGKI
jgi:protein-S-isoprenylcysteine O-methyltransferase Ste14